MIYAMELTPPKLWWDVFCSTQCCAAVHGDEAPEWFVDKAEFEERVGAGPIDPTKWACFNCNKELSLA